MINEEQIKNLIRKGYELKLISFEFNIPIEILEKYKLEITDKPLKAETTASKPKEKVVKLKQKNDSKSQLKIRTIKSLIDNYYKLYNEEDKVERIETRQLSEKEQEKINSIINEMNEVKNSKITYEISETISKKIKSIEALPVTLDDLETLYKTILNFDGGFFAKAKSTYSKTSYNIGTAKAVIARKMVKIIDAKAKQTDDIEELEKLNKKLTLDMETLIIYGTKSRVTKKITELKNKKSLNDFLNSASQELLKIIDDLANGELDVQEAKKFLEEESKISNIALNQLIIKIKMKLERREAINNPEKAIKQLAELDGRNVIASIRTVISNLTNNNEYETAKAICEKYYRLEYGNANYRAEIRSVNKIVVNNEIGYLFRKMIDMSEEEQIETFDKIKEELRIHNISIKNVLLGKNKGGYKSITLADVCSKRENEILRD